MPANNPLAYAAGVSQASSSVGLPSGPTRQRSSPMGQRYGTGSFDLDGSTFGRLSTARKAGPTMKAKNTPLYSSAPMRKSMVDRMYNKAGMAGSALSTGGRYGSGRIGAGAVAMNVAGMGSYMSGGGYFQGAVTGGVTGAAVLGGMSLASYGMKSSMKSGHMPMNSFTKGTAKAMATMVGKGARRYTFGAGAMLGGLMFGGNRSHAGGFNKGRGNKFGR